MKKVEEKEIAKFWTENPMIHQDPEGDFDLNSATPEDIFKHMEKIHRRKGSLHQKEGAPLLSKYINYDSLKGKKILDIGFGTGWLTAEFQKKAKMVYGIELSKSSLKISKYRFKKL